MKTVNHNQLENLIKMAYNKKLPLFIHGAIGIGKSESVKVVAQTIAKDNKLEFSDHMEHDGKFCFVDVRISQLDSTDLRGIPTIDGKTTRWVTPNWLPNRQTSKGILFFDELNLAPPSIQSSCYQIILDRRLGDYVLPDGWVIVSAGNRMEDRANIFDLPMPLANRLMHIELRIPEVSEWVEWALKHDIDSRIITYLNFKNHLYTFNDKNKDKAFATPRTWEYCSKMIKGIDDLDQLNILVSSCVGEAIGIEFTAYIKLKDSIDMEDIIKNPSKAKIPEDISVRYAIVSNLLERFRKDKKIIKPILEVSNRIQPELVILLLKLIREQDSRILNENINTKEFKDIVSNYGKYLL